MRDLRRLDFDDLLLLQQLLEGKTLTSIAESLNISQPAISQRLKKMGEVFGYNIVRQQGRRVELAEKGMALAHQAVAALRLMRSAAPSNQEQVINIGTRPEVGMSWLGEAIFDLRKSHPHLCFHVHVASGSEILQKLTAGTLDAVLTSAPITVRDFRSIELVNEHYVFVARKNLKKVEELQSHVLIEYDRSFPFLRYLDPDVRASISFHDVWFLGSTVLMARAIEKGHGIGIVPKYLVQKSIDQGRLFVLPFSKDISHDSFRLILRSDPVLEQAMKILAQEMQKIGLR